ncbi:MAG: FAD-dependent oxidoreductase [Planctomycetota bacterium]
MGLVRVRIAGKELSVEEHRTILEAAREAGVYVPNLCHHPDLVPTRHLAGVAVVYRGGERVVSDDPDATWDGCGLCAVQLDGTSEPVRACVTPVAEGLVVTVESEHLRRLRRERLATIFATHPHACLTCAQREGCSRTQCSSNVPIEERCCELLGHCELQRVAEYIGLPENLQRYRPSGHPTLASDPLFDWNLELCIGCLRCVRACCDLRTVGAISFVMKDGRPLVGTVGGPTRRESNCRFCGTCVEVCPTGALTEKVKVPAANREQTLVPCRASCPAGIDIPRFVRAIAQRDYARAIAVIREKLPFAFAPSYVCFHPCETKCRRGLVNQPISVCRLKRFVADLDQGAWRERRKRLPPTGKKVAVVGSGPAGLTAAYYLAKQGHAVTIYEALPEPGGMLRVGIPTYRYPRKLLEQDIEEIRNAGVEIRCNAPVADAGTLAALGREHDAVFLATGAHASRRIAIPGLDLDQVFWGVEFLREHALGRIAPDSFAGERVLVIGGGNVAVDAARVARRLGAASVCVVSLEAFGDLPAYDVEVEEAREDGIEFLPAWGPTAIVGARGKPRSVLLRRCTRVFDDAGHFNPAYDDSEMREERADAVILAIGQSPTAKVFAECGLGANATLAVDPETLRTRRANVYAGGDLVTGPRSVIEAIAMGRRAASNIDRALGGDGDIEEHLVEDEPRDRELEKVDGFADLARRPPVKVAPAERVYAFTLVDLGLAEEDAVAEARRCLRCNLRLEISEVEAAPRREETSLLGEEAIAAVPEAEGVYQLLDEAKKVVAIKGVMNLRAALSEALQQGGNARYFVYELDPMYSKRESELIQQYLQQHGEMPGGGAGELDDLF